MWLGGEMNFFSKGISGKGKVDTPVETRQKIIRTSAENLVLGLWVRAPAAPEFSAKNPRFLFPPSHPIKFFPLEIAPGKFVCSN